MITNAQRGATTETIHDNDDFMDGRSYLEIEDEMEIVEALNKLTQRIETMREREKLMRIG